jgi:hypothetical protein
MKDIDFAAELERVDRTRARLAEQFNAAPRTPWATLAAALVSGAAIFAAGALFARFVL